ncbi:MULTISPECIES: hypothetical protein [unclassified Acinetobacter]|uniref:hypothetical protein n=1 Tax=unclassified Acinetobacter TaxID=196816 RepID=UPI0018EDC5B5|nr:MULTISPECIES: hypothetical protein [unclassified Acinetobacter]MBJ6351072.1 hypothetical protein [Acinetobacter sp. c1]MBM0956698.1 hypothetical protein [Acinetobacter sp. C13]
MEVRIKSVNGSSPLPENLQMNVVYKAVRVDAKRMKVTCDDGQVITTNISKSGYLGDWGEWEIVSEDKA